MTKKFEQERQFVLDIAKQGIDINLKLNSKQKKYIKNLLLFALMNASSDKSIKNEDFTKTVNELFKTYLVKILKESFDDDDEDWESTISVELNKIIAKDNLKKLAELQEVFTPIQIFSFLKKYTKGMSEKDLLLQLKSLKKSLYENDETEESKKTEKTHLQNQKNLILQIKSLRDDKTNYRETPEEQRKREQNIRNYSRVMQKQRVYSKGQRTL